MLPTFKLTIGPEKLQILIKWVIKEEMFRIIERNNQMGFSANLIDIRVSLFSQSTMEQMLHDQLSRDLDIYF